MIWVTFTESQNSLNWFDTDDNQSQFKSPNSKNYFSSNSTNADDSEVKVLSTGEGGL